MFWLYSSGSQLWRMLKLCLLLVIPLGRGFSSRKCQRNSNTRYYWMTWIMWVFWKQRRWNIVIGPRLGHTPIPGSESYCLFQASNTDWKWASSGSWEKKHMLFIPQRKTQIGKNSKCLPCPYMQILVLFTTRWLPLTYYLFHIRYLICILHD